MGIKERRDREKHEMHELILQAALELFLTHGYDNLSIRNIAEKIEYSPATIYLYFRDKDEILEYLYNRAHEKFVNYLVDGVAGMKEPWERIITSCRSYVKFAMENPDSYMLMFHHISPIRAIKEEEWRTSPRWKPNREGFEFLEGLIRGCMEAGYFPADMSITFAAFSIWSFLHGMSALYIANRLIMLPPERLEDTLYGSIEWMLTRMRTAGSESPAQAAVAAV